MKSPWWSAGVVLIALNSVFAWDAGNGISVDVTKSPLKIEVAAGGKTLVRINSFSFGPTEVASLEEVSETAEKMTLKKGAVEIAVTAVYNGVRFYAAPEGAGDVEVSMKDLGDHFFGIIERLYPDNQKSPDLRGNRLNVEINGNEGMEEWASAWSAFYMSSRGYGSFFNTFAKGQYNLPIEDEIRLRHKTGVLDWYLFYGPTGDKIHEGYFKVISDLEGGLPTPKKVPIWALGPSFWKDNYESKDEIMDDVEQYTDHEFPATHFWVDRPYSDGEKGWGIMNWNYKFGNPTEWIGTIRDTYGMATTTWIAPCTFGNICEGCWADNKFRYIDLSDPQGVTWFRERLIEHQYTHGVVGHKLDRAEEQFSLERWADGTPNDEKQNKYVYMYGKVVHELLDSVLGQDNFAFSRAAYHRVQPYISALWGGDSEGPFEGYANNLANAMRCGFMGFPVWGSDVGGYKSRRINEVGFTRWVQFGAWSGFFEIMLDDREPWTYPESFQNNYRKYHELRMRMLPYVYSIANTADKLGVMMQPMAYRYPEDENTYDLWSQYLFGPCFLVAPITDAGEQRSVYFPEGVWYDFDDPTTSYAETGNTTVAAPLSKIPVFVRKNSLYPSGSIYAGNTRTWIADYESTKHLTIHAFPGDPGQSFTFRYVDYLDGDTEKELGLRNEDGSIFVEMPAMTCGGRIEVLLDQDPGDKVYLNGEQASGGSFDAATSMYTVPYSADSPVTLQLGGDLPVRRPGVIYRRGGMRIVREADGSILVFTGRRAFSGEPVKVHLADLRGRTLGVWEVHSASVRIPASRLSSGCTLLTVGRGRQVLTSRKILTQDK